MSSSLYSQLRFIDVRIWIIVVLCDSDSPGHSCGAGTWHCQGWYGWRPGGQGWQCWWEWWRHCYWWVTKHLMTDGRACLVNWSVHVSGGSRGDDGWHCPLILRPGSSCLVLESRYFMEDMSQRLVLRPPVQEVVPVVAASHLLLTLNHTENIKHVSLEKNISQQDKVKLFYCSCMERVVWLCEWFVTFETQ